jgi:hypothetical protein
MKKILFMNFNGLLEIIRIDAAFILKVDRISDTCGINPQNPPLPGEE